MIKTQNNRIHKIGFWAAVVAFIGAVGYIVSFPLQILNVVNYMQDSILAFGFSLIISVPILLLGGIPWAITVPACLLLLALFFRSKYAIQDDAISSEIVS